ncbi:MAG: TIGR01777 family oxidoreductase [Desulfocapsaceae bacterium]|nr:TIGR01777 family oxidoreductase [Desulfocapsaceae bacterium]
MKIFITGGTGFVGANLTRQLLSRGYDVTVASSRGGTPSTSSGTPASIKADTTKEGPWQEKLGDYEVIINLTGRTIFNYWSESYKKKIYGSRVETTRNIVNGLPEKTETVLLNASAAGYYGDTGDVEQDESGSPGSDFLAKVAQDWEKEAYKAEKKGARVATMRFGVILGRGGGAIQTMKTPFKLGMGGPIGDGKQYFPWIHLTDLIAAVLFLMNGSDLHGPFNFTAPESVRQKDFAKKLAKTLSRPAFMPAPSFIMKTVLGDFGKSLLTGQKVIPKALQQNGFAFQYPRLDEALEEILHG